MILFLTKYLFYSILSLWIILTLIFQNKYLRSIILKFFKNDFNIIPVWTLFAPNPISNDYYIVYRDYYSDNTISDLKVFQNNFTVILHERFEKATLTMIFNILRGNKKNLNINDEQFLSEKPEYRKLKYILKKHNLSKGVSRRQFLIVDMNKSRKTGIFNPIIISNIKY